MKNPLTKHKLTINKENKRRPTFPFEILKTFRSALECQIYKVVMMGDNKIDHVLNSKTEWNHPRIPRVVVEIGDKVKENKLEGNEDKKITLEMIRKEVEEKKKKKRPREDED